MGDMVNPFTYAGESIANFLASFVTSVSTELTTDLGYFAGFALSIYFMVFGYYVATGHTQYCASEFIRRMVVICFVIALALGVGVYQEMVVGAFNSLEQALVLSLAAPLKELDYASVGTSDPFGNVFLATTEQDELANLYARLDWSFSQGVTLAKLYYDKKNQMQKEENDSTFLIGGLEVAIATLLVVVFGGAILIMAKIAITILLALGPLFIFCLMFPATRRFFDLWLAQLCTYILTVVLMTVVLAIVLPMFDYFIWKMTEEINNFNNTGNANYVTDPLQMVVIAVVFFSLIMQVPNIAGALGRGAGLSALNPHHHSPQGMFTSAGVRNKATAAGATTPVGNSAAPGAMVGNASNTYSYTRTGKV
jgi:type IV secretion system protein VirB6